MKKGLVLLSVVVLFGVSGCNFFGCKKEEATKETKEVAENDMMTNAGQEQAMHDADVQGTLVAAMEQAEGGAAGDMHEEQGMGHEEHDMHGEEPQMNGGTMEGSHEGHDHDVDAGNAGAPEGQPAMPQEQETK